MTCHANEFSTQLNGTITISISQNGPSKQLLDKTRTDLVQWPAAEKKRTKINQVLVTQKQGGSSLTMILEWGVTLPFLKQGGHTPFWNHSERWATNILPGPKIGFPHYDFRMGCDPPPKSLFHEHPQQQQQQEKIWPLLYLTAYAAGKNRVNLGRGSSWESLGVVVSNGCWRLLLPLFSLSSSLPSNKLDCLSSLL